MSSCYLRFWYTSATPDYGNCFTFNLNYNLNDKFRKRNSTLTGSSYGLVLQVFLDQGNYTKNSFSSKAGARLVIHDPDLPPMVDENGIDLLPNTASSISIQMEKITRMEPPFTSNCTNDWKISRFEINTIPYSAAVSKHFCAG